MDDQPMTRFENMSQFLLEYHINPEKEPINTVMFHLKAAESELAETQRLLTQTSAEREHNGRIAEERRKQRDELSGHYHRLNAENVVLQQQCDRLAEALRNLCEALLSKEPQDITDLLYAAGEALQTATPNKP